MKVDMETLAKSTGISNTELLKGFVRDFFIICSKDLERIPQSIEKGDNEGVIRHSHNIYGAAYRLRLEDIKQAAAYLVRAANKMETEKYDKLYDELAEVFTAGQIDYKETA